ncbi:MAG: hypothetical protein HQL42_10815 [Alphaproteobacteria bacterium]|nr:hypothetical protein [Alphaproteobacteria bacterium]
MAATKNKTLIVAGLVMIVAGGGWMIAKSKATAQAKDAIDGFLIRTKLAAEVRYRDLSASPFGSATLSGVTLGASSPTPVVVGSIDISDIEMKGDQLRAIRIVAKDAEIPLLSIARQQHRPDDMMKTAIGLGYSRVTATLETAIRFDESKGALAVDSSGKVADGGSWDARVRLAGIDAKAVDALYGLANGGKALGGAAVLGLIGSLGDNLTRLSLVEMKVGVDNSGWFKRANTITDLDMPPDGANGPAFDEAELIRAGMAPSEAQAARRSVETWLKSGGGLNVATNLGQPLPLFRGSVFAPSFTDLPAFLAMTKSRIGN